jgi:sugar transport protein
MLTFFQTVFRYQHVCVPCNYTPWCLWHRRHKKHVVQLRVSYPYKHPISRFRLSSQSFALVNAVFSASAFFYIEKVGRRTLLLSSLIGMFPFLLLTGHYMDAHVPPNLGAVIPLVLIYVAIYSPGAGVSFARLSKHLQLIRLTLIGHSIHVRL